MIIFLGAVRGHNEPVGLVAGGPVLLHEADGSVDGIGADQAEVVDGHRLHAGVEAGKSGGPACLAARLRPEQRERRIGVAG